MNNLRHPQIIFEDDYILVVNKPAGLIVNRADTVKGIPTLQDWVEEKFKVPASPAGRQSAKFKVEEEDEFVNRSGIVHRLDKETSGLLITAKDPESFKNLQAQFKNKQVEKTYTALVHGRVTPTEGEIEVPIGRLPWNKKRFGVVAMGRESKTLYKVLRYYNYLADNQNQVLTLLEAYPKTGRTHQIRVHFRYLGFPIFSDEFYAGRKVAKRDRRVLGRHFLHATNIAFMHPATRERIELSSGLEETLSNFLKTLTVVTV